MRAHDLLIATSEKKATSGQMSLMTVAWNLRRVKPPLKRGFAETIVNDGQKKERSYGTQPSPIPFSCNNRRGPDKLRVGLFPAPAKKTCMLLFLYVYVIWRYVRRYRFGMSNSPERTFESRFNASRQRTSPTVALKSQLFSPFQRPSRRVGATGLVNSGNMAKIAHSTPNIIARIIRVAQRCALVQKAARRLIFTLPVYA